jgi:hypothetical protein
MTKTLELDDDIWALSHRVDRLEGQFEMLNGGTRTIQRHITDIRMSEAKAVSRIDSVEVRQDHIDVAYGAQARHLGQIDSLLSEVLGVQKQHDARFDQVDARLSTVEVRLDSVEKGLDRVDERLNNVEVRLREGARPGRRASRQGRGEARRDGRPVHRAVPRAGRQARPRAPAPGDHGGHLEQLTRGRSPGGARAEGSARVVAYTISNMRWRATRAHSAVSASTLMRLGT